MPKNISEYRHHSSCIAEGLPRWITPSPQVAPKHTPRLFTFSDRSEVSSLWHFPYSKLWIYLRARAVSSSAFWVMSGLSSSLERDACGGEEDRESIAKNKKISRESLEIQCSGAWQVGNDEWKYPPNTYPYTTTHRALPLWVWQFYRQRMPRGEYTPLSFFWEPKYTKTHENTK